MDVTQLRSLYAAKLAEAKQVAAKWQGKEAEMPKETADQINALLGQADEIKLKLDLALKIAAGDAYLHEPRGAPAAHAGWRDAGPGEGLPADGVGLTIDRKTGELAPTDERGELKIAVLRSGQYKDALNRYIRTAWKMSGPSLSPEQTKVLQEGQDSAGGFWVIPDFRTQLVKKEATMAAIRPNARAFTVGSDVVSFPKVVYTTDDKYTSGTRFAWTAEAPAADISESTNPVAGRVNIPVHTATAAIILTRANMEDAQFDLIGLVSELMTEAFVLGEDDAFINGDGVGKPQGLLQHPNATVAHGSGGMYVASGSAAALAWGTDGAKGITGIEGALPPQYDGFAKWYAAKATYAALRALNTGSTGVQWGFGESYPNAANGYSPSLLGSPITKDQFFPAVAANAFPLAYGDMQGYWIADRVGITLDVLRELRALRDEVILYARKRVGGQLVHDWRVKLQKIATS